MPSIMVAAAAAGAAEGMAAVSAGTATDFSNLQIPDKNNEKEEVAQSGLSFTFDALVNPTSRQACA